MGWYSDSWTDWKPQKKTNWFKQKSSGFWDDWKPSWSQPTQASLILDAWAQRQGRTSYMRQAKSFFSETDAGDFFTVAHDTYLEFAAPGGDKQKRKTRFIQAVLTDSSFEALRVSTKLDVTNSHIAAAVISEAYKLWEEKEKQKQKGGGSGQGNGQPEDGDGSSPDQEAAQAAAKAIKKAMDRVNEAGQLGNAFGTRAGTGVGQPSQGEIDAFLKIFQVFRESEWLQNVIKFAGRMRAIARSRQKAIDRHGSDTCSGVEIGDSIERMIAEEWALMSFPEMEYEVLQRLADGEAQQIEMRGSVSSAYGPVILAVDESGSMGGLGHAQWSGKKFEGSPFEQAMGIALTVAWIARSQRRWVGLYTFQQGRTTRKLILDPNSTKADDSRKLMKWITTYGGGGTDTAVVCDVIPEDVDAGLLGRVRGKADLLVISDGDMMAHREQNELVKRFSEWKEKHKIRVKGLLVGTKRPAMLKHLADENVFADSMYEDSAIAEAIFSIQDKK